MLKRRYSIFTIICLVLYSHVMFVAIPKGRPTRTANKTLDSSEEFQMGIAQTTYRVGFDEYEATEFTSSYFVNSGWKRDIIFSRGKNWDPGKCARL